MRQVLTTEPTALTGLVVGTIYALQVRGAKPVFIETGTAAPANSDSANVIRADSTAFIQRKNAADEIYVWVQEDFGGTGAIIYNEAPG